MKYGRLNPSYAVFCFVFRHVLPRFSNLIVVSRLLERHLKAKAATCCGFLRSWTRD